MSTIFQNTVYLALQRVPKGRVTTYKILANFIHCKSSQAIGQALTKNQNAPEIPCHRVIRTNRNIGGYAFVVKKKREILASEGVHFDLNDNLINEENIWDFAQKV